MTTELPVQKRVELEYPRDRHECVLIGLLDTRAADDLRVSYDFHRDGWVIEQASVFEWSADDPSPDSDWQEVAFVKAWNRTLQ